MKDREYISVRMRRLTVVLRRLRKESGLSGIQVARRIGVSPSTISRAESGKRPVNRDDLAAMLTVYGTPRELRKALLKLHDEAEQFGMLDRGELQVHEDLQKWIGFEQDAIQIHNFQPLLIPGLLQTFPYARAVIEGFGVPLSDDEIDRRVAARIGRQAILRGQRPPFLNIVLHEAALHHRVGGPEIMREQLGYLLESAFRPNITVRVIPRDAGAHAGMDGAFVIMDYPVLPGLVLLENKVASLYLEEPADVEAYKLAYESLLAVALPTDRSVDLISKIAAGMA